MNTDTAGAFLLYADIAPYCIIILFNLKQTSLETPVYLLVLFKEAQMQISRLQTGQ